MCIWTPHLLSLPSPPHLIISGPPPSPPNDDFVKGDSPQECVPWSRSPALSCPSRQFMSGSLGLYSISLSLLHSANIYFHIALFCLVA